MTMSVCKFCGCGIMWGKTSETGQHIALDRKAEVFSIEAGNWPDGSVRILPMQPTEAMVAHKYTCARFAKEKTPAPALSANGGLDAGGNGDDPVSHF